MHLEQAHSAVAVGLDDHGNALAVHQHVPTGIRLNGSAAAARSTVETIRSQPGSTFPVIRAPVSGWRSMHTSRPVASASISGWSRAVPSSPVSESMGAHTAPSSQ